MKNQNKQAERNTEQKKKVYTSPRVDSIELDTEISILMSSSAPFGDPEALPTNFIQKIFRI